MIYEWIKAYLNYFDFGKLFTSKAPLILFHSFIIVIWKSIEFMCYVQYDCLHHKVNLKKKQ